MQTEWIPIKHLKTNDGQIPGVPKNPRYIRNDRFDLLKQSITDDPEMMQIRELVVYPLDGKYIAICGNMRLKACRALGWTEIPCKVLDTDMPAEKLRALAIKDNNNFGDYDWDMVANEWEIDEITHWGIELPELDAVETDLEEIERPEISLKGDVFELIITCKDETSLNALYDKMKAEGYPCRVSTHG